MRKKLCDMITAAQARMVERRYPARILNAVSRMRLMIGGKQPW